MTWYENAVRAARRIDPAHTSAWKLASTYALLSIAESLRSRMPRPEAVNRPQAETLLTTAEVAEITRLPVATLRYWRHLGERGPKSFKLGRRVMYRRVDVEQWLENADGS